MPDTLRAAILATLALLFAGTLLAQEPPSFYLEGIRIFGLQRTSEEIVLSELLLRPNHSYTEPELEQARRRILRLPSIRDAELSLEKGSLEGRYVLVVEIQETKPFFFGLLPNVYSGDLNSVDILSAGGRAFIGKNGMLHLAAGTGDDSGAEIGYTQHGLFGRGAVVSVAVGRLIDDNRGTEPSLRLFASIPLDAKQSVQLTLSSKAWTRRFGALVVVPGGGESPTLERPAYDVNARSLLARWVHDTTDDPFLPITGTSLSLGAELEVGDSVLQFRDLEGPGIVLPETDRTTLSVVGSLRHHWAVGALDSIWVSGFARAGRHDWSGVDQFDTSDLERHFTGVGWLGYTGSFWDAGRTHERGDFRWELAVGARYDENTMKDGTLVPRTMEGVEGVLTRNFVDTEGIVFLALVRRTSWGVFRLGFGWGEDL